MFEGFLFRFLALHFYVLALCLKVFVIKKSYLFKYYFYIPLRNDVIPVENKHQPTGSSLFLCRLYLA